MNAIEYVLTGVASIITLLIGLVIGIRLGIKKGRRLKSTDETVWRYYPYYKNMKEKHGYRDDQIMAQLMKNCSQRQAEAVKAFYDKYEKKRTKEKVEEFKEQFKEDPLGKKLTDAIFKQ